MTPISVIIVCALILHGVGVAAFLVLGGFFALYLRAAEHRSERTLTRIFDPDQTPEPPHPDTDTDGATGQPHRSADGTDGDRDR